MSPSNSAAAPRNMSENGGGIRAALLRRAATWVCSAAFACAVNSGPASAADLTVVMAAPDWLDMIGGKLNGQMAFMSGKLKLKGDMGLAMKLGSLFQT